MDKIKKGLGRGLSSLIGETKIELQKNQLSVSDLIPNKYQPRKNFDEESLKDLTNSIKERGIIQPIIVRKLGNENLKFEIIAGERRWLAAQRAGMHNVPVVITEADDLKSLEFAIVENVQRNDLNPLNLFHQNSFLVDIYLGLSRLLVVDFFEPLLLFHQLMMTNLFQDLFQSYPLSSTPHCCLLIYKFISKTKIRFTTGTRFIVN